MRVFTADFETTNEKTCPTETNVWAWGIKELYKDTPFQWGKKIDDFMSFCASGGINDSKQIFFHNLKFDGFFLLDYLLRSGVEWSDTHEYTTDKDGKQKKVRIPEKANTFRTLITKDGLFYQIEWIVRRSEKNVKKVVFQDSHKKLPFKVSRIAKAFKLPLVKGEIDHDKIRPKGYEPTKEELEYLHNDVVIMSKALEIQIEEGQSGMTIGQDSLDTFKNIISTDSFKRYFPRLDDDWNDDIRLSYKGGFTYLNPRFKNHIIKGGKVYDVNSLYPAMMLKPMPYGTPIKYEGKYKPNKKYPLYIQKLVCDFDLKEGMIPTIQIKGNPDYKSTEYLTSSDSRQPTLMLTSIDLKLFFEHYDVTVYKWCYGYMFQQIEGIFTDYIMRFMSIKEISEGAKRELAKLLLNNLYGKFATDTDATPKIPFLVDDKVKLDTPDEILSQKRKKKSVYTAVGSFITSYARETTITACQNNYDRFIYADTDSLHLVGYEPVTNIPIHDSKIGYWKNEGDFTKGKFIRAKTYIENVCYKYKGIDEYGDPIYKPCNKGEEDVIKLKVTCAGMPDEIKEEVNFDNFHTGMCFHGKLKPRVVKGGVILVEEDFTLKV